MRGLRIAFARYFPKKKLSPYKLSGVVDGHKYGDYIDDLGNQILKKELNDENKIIYRSLSVLYCMYL